MKSFALSVGWFTVSFMALYLPLCFSALSFNPVHWSHTERFFFAVVLWLGVGSHYIKKFIPQKYSL
jgi:hypothetical protein